MKHTKTSAPNMAFDGYTPPKSPPAPPKKAPTPPVKKK
jgi:hypothetical protein